MNHKKGMKMRQILKKAKKDKIDYVNFQFSDIHGFLKSFEKPISKLEEALTDGLWFDGSSVEGVSRIKESDMFLIPDGSTYSVIPWDRRVARIICDVHTADGNPFEGDPRYVLKKVLKEAEQVDLDYYVGPEFEFFMGKLDENGNFITHDQAGYYDLIQDKGEKIRREIMDALQEFGIRGDAHHHEVAPGQNEIDIEYGKALTLADSVLTSKWCVKKIAEKHGLVATFMPKPLFGENGSGMHVHQSLFNDGKNIFFDEEDKYNLSKVAYSFVAGQLNHAKGLAAIVAPTVNSYKRLVSGYEAPVYICWAQQNRSSLIRIPKYKKGKEKATRAELRCPDPSANPYLVFAAMLKTGLEGIKKEMKAPEPVEEDVYHFTENELREKNIGHLPYSLMDALKDLKNDDVVKEALGPKLTGTYLEAKTKEWDDFRIQVTDWERKKYLITY